MKKIISVLLLLFLAMTLCPLDLPEDMLPCEGTISSSFGLRNNPMGGGAGFHNGIDIKAPIGTPVYATHDGVVAENYPAPDGYWRGHPVYGGMIIIESLDGYATLYGHLSHVEVRTGTIVKKGDKIGEVGNTGMSTGAHLHYEILINPIFLFIKSDEFQEVE